MKKAIAYLRVSSEKQVRDGHGLEVQEKAILNYALENGIEVVSIFRDEGISGAEDLEKRKGMAEAINSIKSEKIPLLLVQKLDRVARDSMLLGYIEFELKRAGCDIVAVDQEFEQDPTGILMKNIIIAFAGFEKQLINLRTASGKKNKIEKKLFTAGSPPLGYKLINKDKLDIDPVTAPIVKYIFLAKQEKKSLRKIAQEVQELFNFKINHSSVSYVLNNNAYYGKYRQEKTKYIDIPPMIID
jgi:site-specific DNA recombinase